MDRRFLAGGLAVAVVAVAVALAVPAFGADDEPASPRTITVTGTGTVEAVPDEAEMSLGVSATAPAAAAARDEVDRKVEQVIALLRERGVAEADIQTSQISLSPAYTPRGDAVSGYTASNVLTVRLRDLDAAGELIPAAVELGANQLAGPTLVVSDREKLYRDALKEAVADARVRADAIAAASGGTLGEVRAVTEGTDAGGPIPLDAREARTPIEPGTLEVQAQATVVFALV